MNTTWDCHKHKTELCISDIATIYHLWMGQLCYAEKHYNCELFYPIRFKNKAVAQKWIESGTIAELQEGLSVLAVGFSVLTMEPRI